MPGDNHNYLFRYICSDHIPYSSTAKIVKDFYTNSSFPASILPGLVESFNPVIANGYRELTGIRRTQSDEEEAPGIEFTSKAKRRPDPLAKPPIGNLYQKGLKRADIRSW